ncbi:MAG: hypothetical protein KA444_06850 [Bacteroidia bacterium]|nr:hypothetical protein [Bacteroidia bacterium]
MSSIEIQDYLHLYSMFSFKDGRKEPGILINKYNLIKAEIEYFFVSQFHMQAYKTAFEKYDKESCNRLAEVVNIENLVSIRPVSLRDYKLIMELLHERNEQLNSIR